MTLQEQSAFSLTIAMSISSVSSQGGHYSLMNPEVEMQERGGENNNTFVPNRQSQRSSSPDLSLHNQVHDRNSHDADTSEASPTLHSSIREEPTPAMRTKAPTPQTHKDSWHTRCTNFLTRKVSPKTLISKATTPGSNRNRGYFTMWWWEATCCIIAVGALLAIVGTIYSHEGRPLPRWRFGLTINAIIAIYTVIIKAAAGLVLAEGISHIKWVSLAQPQLLSTFVAHDNASRGPLGSFELLRRNQYFVGKLHVLPFVSSFGALLTVLMLSLDPFSQQIIRNYECNELTTENGTISRANMYVEV